MTFPVLRFLTWLLPLIALAAPPAIADQPSAGEGSVLRIRVASAIHPVVADFVDRSLQLAASQGARAVVLELDTPGGSLQATRRIAQSILGSSTPVMVLVAPGGAQAASAGFFILLAADVAAMAPGTNTGAAHPVAGGGRDLEGDLGAKVEQDTLALIRSLASQRGRDLELAQAAVLESRAFTAEEALETGLIDHLVADVGELLAAADGSEIRRPGRQPVVLDTADAVVEERSMPPFQRVLSVIAQPQIAGLLMALGLLGLYTEITNPGTLIPGIAGAISLILGFFALSVLPVSSAGLLLILLALVLFVAEVQVPSFGVLTVGGAVALGFGLMMTFEDADPSMALHPAWVVAIAALACLFAGFTTYQTLRSRRAAPVTGPEGMLGERGVVRVALEPTGKVFVHGELWRARAERPVHAGAEVEVTAVDGLTLRVRPVADSPSAAD